MKDRNQPFEKRFEEYVFEMIARYINRLDGPGQAHVIALYGKLHDQLYTTELPRSTSTTSQAKVTVGFWRERVELIRRLLTSHQRIVVSVRSQIERMDWLIKRANQNLKQTTRQASLLAHHLSVKQRLVATLERAQLTCQHKLFKLVVGATASE